MTTKGTARFVPNYECEAFMKYKNYEDLPLVLSVSQLAEVLEIGRNAAYNLVNSCDIRIVRIGNTIRIPKDAVIAFLES